MPPPPQAPPVKYRLQFYRTEDGVFTKLFNIPTDQLETYDTQLLTNYNEFRRRIQYGGGGDPSPCEERLQDLYKRTFVLLTMPDEEPDSRRMQLYGELKAELEKATTIPTTNATDGKMCHNLRDLLPAVLFHKLPFGRWNRFLVNNTATYLWEANVMCWTVGV